MKERLKTLRKKLNLTQQEISDKLGVSRSTYAQYETGRVEPSAAVFALLCREFNVNEKWLRTGEGEMLVKKTEDEEAEYYRSRINELFTDRDEKFRKALLDTVLQLNAEQVKAVKSYAIKYLLPALEEPARPAADPAKTLPEGSGLPEEPAQPAADPAETLPEGSGLSEGPVEPAAEDPVPDGSEPLSVKEEIEIAKKVEDYRRQLRIEKRAEAASSASQSGGLKKEA